MEKAERNEQNLESVDRMIKLAEETAKDVRTGGVDIKQAAEVNNAIGKHAREVAASIALQEVQAKLKPRRQ